MDRETISSYGFLTIATILIGVLLALSTPVGERMMEFTQTQVQTIIDTTGVDFTVNDDGYGTYVFHYKREGSSDDLKTYKTTLRIGEQCLVPSFKEEGYKMVLVGGNKVPSMVTVENKFAEMDIYMVPEQYDLSFELNGGDWKTGTTVRTSYTYGTSYVLPKTIEKEDYKFVGWFEDSGLGGIAKHQIDFDDIGHKTFYAKYSIL
jgi:uncharacterized repeat protein (TIGR02543 family)